MPPSRQHKALFVLHRAIAAAAVLLVFGCQATPEWQTLDPETDPAPGAETFPGALWAKVARPEDLGWSSEKLAKARAFSKEIGSTAVMLVQHGIVVDAWGGIATRSNLHSGRKSLLSGLYGIAVDRQQIDLSATMAELEIDDNDPLTEEEKQATVGDLLKARSGVYHAALYETPRMTASKPPRGSHAPGNYWHYNNWDFNTLGTIFEQQTGERIFEAFDRYFAEPLQMEDFRVIDGQYVTGDKSIHTAYPFRMTARDFARFALLYLRQGRWRDRQILSEAWVAESTATHSEVEYLLGYRYMWWTGIGSGPFPNVRFRAPVYFAAGYGRQLAFVVPHLDLIVVHRVNTDWYRRFPSKEQMGRLFWLILDAAGESNIGPDPGIEAAGGRHIKGDELRRLLPGSTVTGQNRDGSSWRVSYTADGRMSGTSGHANQHGDSGTWRVENDLYCRQWSKWSRGEEGCYLVVLDGQRIKAFDTTGTYRSTMTLMAP